MFGKTKQHIESLERRIKSLEHQLQQQFSKEIELDLLVTREELAVWNQQEETLLVHQEKLNWLEKGEASAQFFRAFTSNSKIMVQEMRLRDGKALKTAKDIRLGVVDYFKNFLQARPQRAPPDLLE